MTKQTLLAISNKICWIMFRHQIEYSKLVCETHKQLWTWCTQTQRSCIVTSHICSVCTLPDRHSTKRQN